MLKAAATTFSLEPVADSTGQKLTFGEIREILSSLDTNILLVEEDSNRLCLVTSHWLGVHYYQYSNLLRTRLASVTSIPFEKILVFGSHNHCSAALTLESRVMGCPKRDLVLTEKDLTHDGIRLLQGCLEAAATLSEKLVPVTASWEEAQEGRITYDNKGRRADGSTYMIRDEDRIQLGDDFHGDIDTHAPVVAFQGEDDRPVAFLVSFAGHPTTCYHPDVAVVWGEYPQVACRALSDAFCGVPVGFLPGCGADSYSLYSFSERSVDERLALSTRNGEHLGETFIRAAKEVKPCHAQVLNSGWQDVFLPYAPPPPATSLRTQLAEIDTFVRRCQDGDEDAVNCVGLNVSRTFSLSHRIAMIEPVRRWTEWVLSLVESGDASVYPDGNTTPVCAVRIGDIGLMGLACEPFKNIGRRFRQRSPLPHAIPCGYLNDTATINIPDSENCNDLEFMSSTYRYTTTMLRYAKPAGDVLADTAAEMLEAMQFGILN